MARIGIPRETKDGEHRVAMTPIHVRTFVDEGAHIVVETGAGSGAGFSDDEYAAAGASIADAETAFAAGIVVKVKEPNAAEVEQLHRGQILLTFLHLPGNPELREQLKATGVTAIASERIEDAQGRLPILYPMSVIAGRMAPQIGAHYLESPSGGRGVVLGGAPGSEPSLAVVVGAGVVGTNAAAITHGLGARVAVVDLIGERARAAAAAAGPRASHYALTELPSLLSEAVLVIGAVHRTGEPADRVVTREMIASMPPRSVAVDVAIDEGGCFETSHPTSHSDPVFCAEGVTHYCVSNIPGAVARTAAEAYASALAPYVSALAAGGLNAFEAIPGAGRGIELRG
jgi:alanine dehydrogenase